MALPSYTGFARVAVDPSTDFEMFLCDRDDGIALRCFWNGVYEPMTTACVRSLARESEAIVDIGAHTGYFTLLAATANPSAFVIAVEPSNHNVSRLFVNIRANAIVNVQVVRAAASDTAGEAALVTNAPPTYHSSGGTISDRSKGGEPVRLARLDDVLGLGDRRVGLVKCDVEGHEARALSGLWATIGRDRPDIVVECTTPPRLAPLDDRLSSLGYRVFGIDEASGRLIPVDRLSSPFDERVTVDHVRNRLATTRSTDVLERLVDLPVG